MLSEWLSEAAYLAGYPAQATSIPGVAQRTGATTYYLELFPERDPAGDPVFCLFPSAGDVDLVSALEPMEAARALQNGYVGPGTTVITARDRIYGIGEKIVAGDGIVAKGAALDALANASKRLITFQLDSTQGTQANALLFGAISASGVLPLTADHCRRAIERVGISPGANLASFERGLRIASESGNGVSRAENTPQPSPATLGVDLAAFPKEHRALIAHALVRLVDYQGEAYKVRYLKHLATVADVDHPGTGNDGKLTSTVARRLAAWMTFEDVIRVAQLKTRPGRLARIRAELEAKPDEPVEIQDYLKPGWDELRGILPKRLGQALPAAIAGRRRRGIALTLPTSRPWGYAALRMIAALRPWRPHTTRYFEEHRAIEAWIGAIVATAPRDYELACRLAELAALARGYGDVRARGLAQLVAVTSDWRQRLDRDAGLLAGEVDRMLQSARNAPDAGCAPV